MTEGSIRWYYGRPSLMASSRKWFQVKVVAMEENWCWVSPTWPSGSTFKYLASHKELLTSDDLVRKLMLL